MLLRSRIDGRVEQGSGLVSDREREFGERGHDRLGGRRLDGDLVVAAPEGSA